MERAKKEFWLLSPANILYFLILLFLPTQLGRHFWPDFSFVSGLRIDYLSPTLYLTDILIILLFIFWFLKNLQKIKKTKFKPSIPFTAFLVVLFSGIFLSESPFASLYGLLKIAEFSFFGFYTMKNIRNLRLVTCALSIGIFFESAMGVVQYFNQGSLNSIFYFFGERTFNSQTPGIANASLDGSLVLRPYATFPHPNVLAGYLVLSMTFVLFSSWKKLKYLVFTMGTIALFLTLSRASIVVWVVVLCLYLFKCRWKLAAGVGILIAGAICFSPLGTRFLNINLFDEAIAQRVELAKAAFAMFSKNPILGVGVNNFLPNLPFYIQQAGNTLFLQPVHNIFLLVLSETGIIGFGFFMWFLFKTFNKIARRNALGLVLFSEILFLGFFDHYFLTLQQGQLLLALSLGLFWSDTI